ncbi:MAG: hypothetical protein ACREHV_15660 [Rhizomicrobium sp.]
MDVLDSLFERQRDQNAGGDRADLDEEFAPGFCGVGFVKVHWFSAGDEGGSGIFSHGRTPL